MSLMIKRWELLIGIIGVVIALDQLTKNLVLSNLQLGESRQIIPALAPFFQVTRSENRGAAFGFLPQAGDVFLILAAVIVTFLIFYYPRLPQHAHLSRIGFALVCGGALGNALDRLQHDAVIDFIHYTLPGIISNVSNLADHAIVIGVLLLLIESWRSEPRTKAVPEAPTSGDPTQQG
jgi:signal peptidase II